VLGRPLDKRNFRKRVLAMDLLHDEGSCPYSCQSQEAQNFKVLSKAEAMACFKTLLESGQLAPIIARTFPLSEVPAAMRYLQEGCVTERIVITPWSTGAR